MRRAAVVHAIPFLLPMLGGAALTAAAQPGRITKEQAEAALAEFKQFAKHPNPHVRRAAVEGLYSTDHYLVTETLVEALADPDAAVRRAAEVGLETQTSTEGVARLVKRVWLGNKKPERLAILRAFRKSRPHHAFTVVQELCGNRDWEIRAASAELLSFYADELEKALGSLLPLFNDKEPRVRLAAVDAAAALGNPRGNSEILGMLEDPDWRVQSAALKAVVGFRMKSAVQPLIDFMRRTPGRLADDAGQALVGLTGLDFPADPDTWQEWWNRNKDDFKIPSAAEIEERKTKAEAALRGYAKPKSAYPPYHGIETRSRRMIFVLDISSSMAEKVTIDETNQRAYEEFRARYGDSRVKIDIAREELINLIAALPSYVRFNIITFDAEVRRWEKDLVPATADHRNRAIKHLVRLTPAALVAPGSGRRGGAPPAGTNTFEAINACFNITSEDGVNAPGYKTEADTVFLLSDGNPTLGRIVAPQALLDYVLEVNKKARLVIHTISFGNANSQLMEPLARRTGGQFVRIGE